MFSLSITASAGVMCRVIISLVTGSAWYGATAAGSSAATSALLARGCEVFSFSVLSHRAACFPSLSTGTGSGLLNARGKIWSMVVTGSRTYSVEAQRATKGSR
jgi:hypothetical protein